MRKFTFLLIFLCFNEALIQSKLQIKFEENNKEGDIIRTKIISTLCEIFPNYFIIFHVDDRTVRALDNNLKRSFNDVMIFNYSKKLPKRFSFGNYVNVVLLGNIVPFDSYLSKHKWTNDVFVFIEINYLVVSKTWIRARYPLRMFFVYFHENIMDLYQFMSYSHKLNHITTYNFTEKETLYDWRPTDLEKNLQGYKFNISFVEYFPYLSCIENNSVIGAHINALNVISKKLNFTFSLTRYQSYTLMMNDLKAQKNHFAIGAIRVTPQRMIDQHMIRLDEQYVPVIYFHRKEYLEYFEVFVTAFHNNVWSTIGLTVSLLIFLVYQIYGNYFRLAHVSPLWSLQVNSNYSHSKC